MLSDHPGQTGTHHWRCCLSCCRDCSTGSRQNRIKAVGVFIAGNKMQNILKGRH